MNLYLRLLRLLLSLAFVRRRGLFETSRFAFRVWPNDCDLNLHMNNGRYLTFMDLGRTHLMAQLGLLRVIVRKRWQPVLAAAEISFLRGLAPFENFTLATRLLTWDEKYIYIEHRFERGQVLCAVALVKAVFLERQRRLAPAEIVAALGIDTPAPPVPAVIVRWNELTALKKEHTSNSETATHGG